MSEPILTLDFAWRDFHAHGADFHRGDGRRFPARARLLATVDLAGTLHHLDLIAVVTDVDGEQHAVIPELEASLEAASTINGSGPFATIRHRRYTYVALLTPFAT